MFLRLSGWDVDARLERGEQYQRQQGTSPSSSAWSASGSVPCGSYPPFGRTECHDGAKPIITHSFTANEYTFTATSDDGIRVWVDGALIIDAWRAQAPTTYMATRTLPAGDHQVKVEYYEGGGGAVARVSWAVTQPPPPPVCPTGQFDAHYFGNATLSGSPTFRRCEGAIDNDWGPVARATGYPPIASRRGGSACTP